MAKVCGTKKIGLPVGQMLIFPEQGREEALEAGRLLKSHDYSFDWAFTSVLKRAIRTLWIVLDELDLMWIPVEKSWRLNERHYGALQGLNKAATAKRYSDEQVHLWRRSYDVQPPALTKEDELIVGAVIRDLETGSYYQVKGRAVINATGCSRTDRSIFPSSPNPAQLS